MKTTKKEIISTIESLSDMARKLKVNEEYTDMHCCMNQTIGKLISLSRHLPEDEARNDMA